MVRGRVVKGIAVVSAVAAGGVGGALIGVPGLSGAQPFPKSATSAAATDGTRPAGRMRGASPLLDAAAKALNLTTQQLLDKLSDGKTTIADVAEQQNVDVNKVVDALASADRDRIDNIVNQPWPKFGGGHGHGPWAGGAPGMRGGPGFGMRGANLDAVAKALGISTDALRTDLGSGRTIAQIAKSKNVEVNKVIDALVADASARIDRAKTDGHLTQAQADKLKTDLKSRITDLVNNGFPKAEPGGRFGPGRGGFGGPPPAAKVPTA